MTDKKFFELDDNGDAQYLIVATDLDHAKRIMRDSGIEFGDPPQPLDDAAGITWSELPPDAVAKKARCHTEDHRGIIRLADADVGDYFCSEW